MFFFLIALSGIDLGKTIHFAERLENEGDYFRAITEYKRYWFYSQDKPDSIIYKIAKIYLREKLPDNAVDILKYINKKDTMYKKICAIAYLQTGNYEKARELWKDNNFTGLTYLHQRKFNIAGKYLKDIGTPDRKSPIIGTLLSIIPGGGKFYAGRGWDGFMSFVGIVSTAIPAYYASKRNDKIKEYIYGGVSLFFYLGNIYGGWLAVKVYNDKSEEKFISAVEINLGVSY